MTRDDLGGAENGVEVEGATMKESDPHTASRKNTEDVHRAVEEVARVLEQTASLYAHLKHILQQEPRRRARDEYLAKAGFTVISSPIVDLSKRSEETKD